MDPIKHLEERIAKCNAAFLQKCKEAEELKKKLEAIHAQLNKSRD